MIPPVGYSVCAVEYIDMCLSITLLVLIETFIISFMESSNSTTSVGTLEFENINLNEVRVLVKEFLLGLLVEPGHVDFLSVNL